MKKYTGKKSVFTKEEPDFKPERRRAWIPVFQEPWILFGAFKGLMTTELKYAITVTAMVHHVCMSFDVQARTANIGDGAMIPLI